MSKRTVYTFLALALALYACAALALLIAPGVVIPALGISTVYGAIGLYAALGLFPCGIGYAYGYIESRGY